MEFWTFAPSWLHAALSGMGSAWQIGLALVITSFLLEDLSIAAAAALATQGLITWEAGFSWVFAGLAVGDMGLYALGWGAQRLPWLRRRYIEPQRHNTVQQRLHHQLGTAVLLARAIPGLRLVTYTLCGFVRVPVLAFCAWVACAVALWVAALFWLGAIAGAALAQALHLPPAVAVALPIVAVALAIPCYKYFQQRRKTKAA
jgi:membrane protein DedA with SNARE-associated domain